jgi:hypothetical protein
MADAPLERLKLLYDYEKFHIGLYGAMITGFSVILKGWSQDLAPFMIWALVLVILSLLVAAICGAILASSVIDVYGNYELWNSNTSASLNSFWTKKIGPYKWGWCRAQTFWRVGHTAFWIAVFLAVGSFLLPVLGGLISVHLPR